MKIDKEFTLVVTLITVMIAGAMLAVCYVEHEKSSCKQAAISQGMPYLEIKEVCK